MSKSKSSLPFSVDTSLLVAALALVNGVAPLVLQHLSSSMARHKMTSITLRSKVGYSDPDAERPEIGSIQINEEGQLEAVDADDPETTFLLQEMDPNEMLGILQALP